MSNGKVPEPRAYSPEPGVLVVEGGAKTKGELPPEKSFDGTPDPEVGKMIAEGQARYHLHALEELASEGMSTEEAERMLMGADDDVERVQRAATASRRERRRQRAIGRKR